MTPLSTLVLTKESHEKIRNHLFPGDGLEAAAILICSRGAAPRLRLIVRDVVLVPHEQCIRERDFLHWPGKIIEDAIDIAEMDDLSLVLLHSHPGGYFEFSPQDDHSDQMVIPSIFQAIGSIHGTAIMVPTGEILARIYRADMKMEKLDLVTVAADDIHLWWSDGAFSKRPMAFSAGSRSEMNRLSVAVIGASGTGSITIEQVARLGFGQIYMIDFDKIEIKNLNRILNAGLLDVGEFKVATLSKSIASHRGEGVTTAICTTLLERDAVLQVSQADFIFCCVDSKEGRQISDLIASAFLIPLFDVGVSIPTRRLGRELAILDACARIDYVRPGGPTLADRNVYTQEGLRAEYLKRSAPKQYEEELADGYIKGSIDEAPAVISLNMRASSDLILEFIARIYPFRHDPNSNYARRQLSFAAGEEEFTQECAFKVSENPMLAWGAQEPLIGLPALARSTSMATATATC